MHGTEQIGVCTLVSDKKRKVRWFNGVNVGKYQGQGFVTATYKEAITHAMIDGYSFRTHEWSQTLGAKRVWERLAEQGVAREVRPFEPNEVGKFGGEYVIDATESTSGLPDPAQA